MFADWAGDFVHAFVMAKMKLLTPGRWLWTRTIGSTVCGQGFDSLLFYPIAFWGPWETYSLLPVVLFNFTMKVTVVVVLTPLTYLVVNHLKRSDGASTSDAGPTSPT